MRVTDDQAAGDLRDLDDWIFSDQEYEVSQR